MELLQWANTLMPKDELIKAISELDRLMKSKPTIDEVEKHIQFIIKGYVTNPFPTTTDWYMFRARVHKPNETDPYTDLAELWCLDKKQVKWPGRLNTVGQSVLYGASSPWGAVKEVRLKKGQTVSILKIKVVEPLDMQFLGVYENDAKNNFKKQYKIVKDMLFKRYPNFEDRYKNDIITKFINKYMTMQIDTNKEHLYNVTIVLANLLGLQSKCDGVIYPGVATSLNHLNFGVFDVKPFQKLVPTDVLCLELTNDLDLEKSIFNWKGFSSNIDKSGNIIYANVSEPTQEELKRYAMFTDNRLKKLKFK